MSVRNFLFDKGIFAIFHSNTKVISVGNISTGGTGKTPVSAYLIEYYLSQEEIKPAYLSRGYGRKSKGLQIVEPTGESKRFGDEALMIANRYPEISVVVCEERKVGIEFLEDKSDVIILDDAFQHRKVARNIDLLVIDANRLPTDDLILPAGNLRESLKSIQRADFLIISKIKSQKQIRSIEAKLAIFGKELAFCTPKLTQGEYFLAGRSFTQSELEGANIWLFSGIGNPQGFEDSVKEIGGKISHHIIFPDHYAYKKSDFDRLNDLWGKVSEKPDFLLTTEKDYFRLKNQPWLNEYSQLPFAYIQMEVTWWKGEKELINLLES